MTTRFFRYAAATVLALTTGVLAYDQPGPFPVMESMVSVPRVDGTAFDALFFHPGDSSELVGEPAQVGAHAVVVGTR